MTGLQERNTCFALRMEGGNTFRTEEGNTLRIMDRNNLRPEEGNTLRMKGRNTFRTEKGNTLKIEEGNTHRIEQINTLLHSQSVFFLCFENRGRKQSENEGGKISQNLERKYFMKEGNTLIMWDRNNVRK